MNDHIAAGMEAVYTVRATSLYESFDYTTLPDDLYNHPDDDDDDDDADSLVTTSSASRCSWSLACLALGVAVALAA